jgi:hypothetical protein
VPTWFVAFSVVGIVVVLLLNCAWFVMIRGWVAHDVPKAVPGPPTGDAGVHVASSDAGRRLGPVVQRRAKGATLDLFDEEVVVTTIPFRGSERWVLRRSSVGSLRITPVPSGALLRLYGHNGERRAVIYVAHRVAVLRQKLASAGWLTLIRG